MSTLWDATLILLIAAVALAFVHPRLGALASLAGAALAVPVGGGAALGHPATVSLGSWLGFGDAALRIDGIAGVFLGLVGITGAAVGLRYAERPASRGVTSLHALVLLSVAVVIGADQAFVFLLAWEGLAVAVYLTASADRRRPGTLLAGYLTGGLNKISGAALLAAFALLHGRTGSFRFSDWHAQAAHLAGHTRSIVFLLLLIGFASKIGVPPLQAGLPAGYEAAPGPAAASLSVALVAGFYGLWRLVFETIGPAQLWWGEVVLVVGALTALVGILYAIADDDLLRFLGFSSVEHTGVTLLGFGAALIGQATGHAQLAAVGLLAATLHLTAHALAKTLALLAAERIGRAAGTTRMRPLGDVGRDLPRTSAALALATVTLAALPPFGGFVSEWFTLESLIQGFRIDDTLAQLLMALAAAALALTAGLGLLAFAKLFGSVVLGRARTPRERIGEPRDPGAGLVLLGACAALLGVAAPWEIRLLGRALTGAVGFNPASHAISHPLVLGPVYGDFSVLAPTWLALVLAAFATTTALAVRLLRRAPVRRAAPWVSGTALDARLVQYTPAGYSNPIRVVLRPLYAFRRSVRPVAQPTPGEPTLVLETQVVPMIEAHVYRPLTALMLGVTAQVRRFQSGRLGTYLAYVLVTLIVIVALIPTLRP
jgi:hydrogenase-4 component B